MQGLTNISLVSAKIEVVYLGTDSEDNTEEHVLSLEPDPAWTALLCRYIENHRLKGQHGTGAKSISLKGSAGEFPKVTKDCWNPNSLACVI